MRADARSLDYSSFDAEGSWTQEEVNSSGSSGGILRPALSNVKWRAQDTSKYSREA